MRHKFHKKLNIFLILFFYFSCSYSQNIPAFDHQALGKCFLNGRDFIKKNLGESALSDENIITSEKDNWIWIVDQTASKNYIWYVLKKTQQKICMKLFVPGAADVNFKTINNVQYIQSFIAPEIDFPTKQINFEFDKKRNYFYPKNCYTYKSNSNKILQKRKEVSCLKIFE